MASLQPGFEYDIFISYRHNDNLDGWVTEFVQNLEKELRGTLKESLTIYFDKNPHDGLLETHHVDKSLEGKLKCLIFIPIVSQTYCDPKSFAWQHEFCAFNKLSQTDILGREVRLNNGNVTSRIFPIKIHDLDEEDKNIIEQEIGGVLRSIEFIFKSHGVNRPLRAVEDHPNDNLNKTFYRDQINKVANSIKEIISAIKNPVNQSRKETTREQTIQKVAKSRRPLFVIAASIILLTALLYFFYSKSTSSVNPEEKLDKSIAVLPFADLSEHKDQGWFGDGLTEEILNSLAHVKGLNVISRTSSFAFKNKNIRIQDIADSLGVNYVVEGSIRKSDKGLRITAQLIRANDGFHIWSNTYDRDAKDIFLLQKEIATNIAGSLDVSLDEKAIAQMQWAGTTSAEAYLAFLKARELDNQAHQTGSFIDLSKLKKANVYYEESSQLDPDFINPYLFHADFYLHYVLNDDPRYQDTLTDQDAHMAFMRDLTKTITLSKEPARADYYRIAKVMYSNDWTNLQDVIQKSLYNEEAVAYFKYQNFDLSSLLICLGHGSRLADISKDILEKDPYDLPASQSIALNLLHNGKYDDAIKWIMNRNIDSSPHYEYYAMIQLGKLDEAYDLILRDPNNDHFAYYDLKALIFAKQGKPEKAKEILSVKHRPSPFYLFAIDEVFGRKKANEVAGQMDNKVLLDFPLFRSLALSPNKLPYDLSATPNFAKRLKQAGISFNQMK